jgi:hypothetical protein
MTTTFQFFFGGISNADLMTALRELADKIDQHGDKTMAILDDLKAHVEYQSSVTNSAIALLDGLQAKLTAALADDANDVDVGALYEIRDELKAQADSLAAAVAKNTVAEAEAPAPYVEPTVEPAYEAPAEPVVEAPVEPAPELAVEAPVEAPVEEPQASVEEPKAE